MNFLRGIDFTKGTAEPTLLSSSKSPTELRATLPLLPSRLLPKFEMLATLLHLLLCPFSPSWVTDEAEFRVWICRSRGRTNTQLENTVIQKNSDGNEYPYCALIHLDNIRNNEDDGSDQSYVVHCKNELLIVSKLLLHVSSLICKKATHKNQTPLVNNLNYEEGSSVVAANDTMSHTRFVVF
mmetsp:Transcript_23227/g.47867  ORF Transcript_23227/g.47867 Transcript_23227/m.47867 type:complete len:182 (-) Transcript_23227:2094-2639(-)